MRDRGTVAGKEPAIIMKVFQFQVICPEVLMGEILASVALATSAGSPTRDMFVKSENPIGPPGFVAFMFIPKRPVTKEGGMYLDSCNEGKKQHLLPIFQ